jgi:hypothetical protein
VKVATLAGAGEATAKRKPWRLPSIPERAESRFRAAWILLALAALTATIAGPFLHAREREEIHKPFFELGLRQADGRTVQTPHSAELRRQGVVSGTEIVAVAGRPVPAEAEMRDVAAMLRAVPGPTVHVTLKPPGGEVRTLNLRRSASYIEEGYRGSGFTYSSRLAVDLGFAGLTNLVLVATALLLFWRRPRDGLAALLSFGLLLWALTENLSWYSWWRLSLTAVTGPISTVAMAAILISLMLFPDGRFRPGWARWVAAALILLCLYLNIELVGVELSQLWFAIPALIVDCAAIAAVVARYRAAPAGTVRKQQERWLALGLAAGIFWLLCTIVLHALPDLMNVPSRVLVWCYVGGGIAYSAFTLSIAGGLLVALLRYRLYDAEAAISRSASVAILTLVFGAVFAGSAKGLELGFEAYLGAETGILPGVLAAILATVIVTPAQSRIQSWASERFQKELAHLRRDLPDCVNDLREVADQKVLATEVLERVSAGVRASHSAIVLADRIVATRDIGRADAKRWLEVHQRIEGLSACEPADPVFPMRVRLAVAHSGEAGVGWLLLGPRPDGSFYRREEREALSEVADPVARALRVATARQSRERREASERRALVAAFAELRERIDRLESQGLPSTSASPVPGTSGRCP